MSRKTIEEILDRYGVALSKKESHLRDRLIHGSMDYDLQDRIAMSEVYHRLRPAVVKELGSHLQRAESPWLPSPDVYSHHAFFNCQYKTAYPSEPFPQDCVTSDDIKEYLTLLPRGHQHPKDIKQLVEWPPNW